LVSAADLIARHIDEQMTGKKPGKVARLL